ncbi:MAG TPA: DoxX family protein [Longimicrobiales bacterium]|nr:DoxX family protein [Longimicrobiales bacterium]
MSDTWRNARSSTGHRALRVALWVAQLALAAMFVNSAQFKLLTPAADIAAMMNLPAELIRFIGAAELAGAIGLILPAATRIYPALTVLAAGGLTTVMLLASGFHLARGEASGAIMTAVLGVIAAFVAYGRASLAPIEPRRTRRYRQAREATAGAAHG